MRKDPRTLEKTIAAAAFLTAVALAFTSLLISEEHEIAANVMLTCAQFLTFSATLLGIDYKFNSHDNTGGLSRQS